MPNYCENDLYLTGEADAIVEALAFIGADQTPPQFDFNKVIPYPEHFQQMDDDYEAIPDHVGVYRDDPEYTARVQAREAALAAYRAKWRTIHDGFNSGGIEWRRTAWGTKWNAGGVTRRDYDGTVCITFQTAWMPPRPIIIALAQRFPDVTFTLEYFERGMQFAGGFQCPGRNDWYDDEGPWKAGMVMNEWETTQYRGIRGG